MARLTTLKPRVAMLNTQRVATVGRAGATPRTRGGAWMRARAAWLREHPLCVECDRLGFVSIDVEVDHRIPLWEGGADDPSNYQTLCREHHQAKTAREARRRSEG